jgi:signal transduction histidine kinase
VAQGDFGQRVDYQAHDEIGALGSALNQMAKQLSNAEQSRKTFLAGVSHELRTPLTTIKANTQAMLDQIISPEEQPEYLASTVEEIDRLRDMVDTLIQVAQPRVQAAPGRVEVDLTALWSDIVRQTAHYAERSAVSMRTESPGRLLTWGDAGQLRQVFLNVLDNAIRFSPPGGEVSIVLAAVGPNVQIVVKDQGCGVSAALLERLFQPFMKAPDSPGTGLGLYLCRQLVQAHGGSISILSSEGHGSAVTILLPLFGGLK